MNASETIRRNGGSHRRRFQLSMILCALLAACEMPTETNATFEAYGIVSNAAGRPIAGAVVELVQVDFAIFWVSDRETLARTTTDSRGRYTIAYDGACRGNVRLRVTWGAISTHGTTYISGWCGTREHEDFSL